MKFGRISPMAVKIRLARLGSKGKPFYRIVVCELRGKRDGNFLEVVGTYNPLTSPATVEIKKDRIEYWLKRGAQFSDTVRQMYHKNI